MNRNEIALALVAAFLAIVAVGVAYFVHDGGPEDGWEAGGLDAMYEDDDDPDDVAGEHYDQAFVDEAFDLAEYDDQLERDLQADAEEYERRTLAGDSADRLQPPEMPELDPCTPRPYIDYVPRHADDTIEFHRVADTWCPPIGAARIAAVLNDTQQFQAVTA